MLLLCWRRGGAGLRRRHAARVPAADFFLGAAGVGAAQPGELAVAAVFPVPPPGTGSAFVEVSRRRGDYALCGVGLPVTLDAGPAGGPGPGRVHLGGPDAGRCST